MNQFEIGEKILYLGIYGNEFNLVDEVIGIEDDEYLNRKKYMIKNTESGEVISQYGTNYRKATKEEVAVGHRLESNNGQAIRVCNLNNNFESPIQLYEDKSMLINQAILLNFVGSDIIYFTARNMPSLIELLNKLSPLVHSSTVCNKINDE
jgi:hypothetical protein